MADRPILFSGPMVRALLDGRKTQTRRVLDHHVEGMHLDRVGPTGWQFTGEGGLPRIPIQLKYAVGDRLWVRESATRFDRGTCDQHIWFHAGRNEIYPWLDKNFPGLDPDAPWPHPEGPGGGAPYSIPSIHMPRWASRITLTVTEVRVQRLQEISEEDAAAEGIERSDGVWWSAREGQQVFLKADEAFHQLWDDINAARGFGWEANPWVVAVTFTVERRNIDVAAA